MGKEGWVLPRQDGGGRMGEARNVMRRGHEKPWRSIDPILASRVLITSLLHPFIPLSLCPLYAGDHISFQIDSQRDLSLTPAQMDNGSGGQVLVQVGHLKSYEHMGVAVAR